VRISTNSRANFAKHDVALLVIQIIVLLIGSNSL
jgi:hypothetical protein